MEYSLNQLEFPKIVRVVEMTFAAEIGIITL
jgi:hypothetical protein